MKEERKEKKEKKEWQLNINDRITQAVQVIGITKLPINYYY